MKLLLDTCTFFWLAVEPEKLSPKARTLLSDADSDVYLSSITAWEIVAKFGAGKLPLPMSPDQIIMKLKDELALLPLPFSDEDAFHSRTLPALHRDPFDRMLICQALVNGCSILTPDEAISQYSVHTIW